MWIERAVLSAVYSYSGAMEVICVDDGSTDGSPDILSRLAEEYQCVKVLRQENKGRSAARNLGIHHARGTWIGFLDADDSVLPDAFDKVLSRSTGDVGLICFLAQKSMRQATDLFARKTEIDPSASVHFDSGSALQFLSDPAYYLAKNAISDDVKSVLSVFDALWCWTVFSKLFNASKLREADVHFEEGLKFGEDVLFVHEYLSQAKCDVAFFPITTHIYNVENPGTTRGYSTGDVGRLLATFKAFASRVLASKYPEELAWRCVEDMLFVSVRAAKYCIKSEGQQEILQGFYDETLLDFCGMLEKDRFRKMGSSVWPIWAWAFRSLKSGAFQSYWYACRVMGCLERLVEMTRQKSDRK